MAGGAAEIWQALPADGRPIAAADLVAGLVATHQIEAQVAEDAVFSVVAELIEAGCAARLS